MAYTTIYMEEQCYKEIRMMIDLYKLVNFQVGDRLYKIKDDSTFECMIDNIKYIVSIADRTETLKLVKESSHKFIQSTISERAEKRKKNAELSKNELLNKFIKDSFDKTDDAVCIKSSVVREIFSEWRKNFPFVDCKIQEVYEYLKDYCGKDSTTKEFWGIKLKPVNNVLLFEAKN